MRRALIFAVLAAFVLTAAGGNFAWAAAGTGASEKSAKKDDKKKDGATQSSASKSYLMIDPIYTTIMDGDSVSGLLMVGIGLDVPDEGLRAEVDRSMPVLRDVYIRSLLSFSAISVRPWRQPDVAALADRLQRATDLKLGCKGARLLLAQVAMRLNK